MSKSFIPLLDTSLPIFYKEDDKCILLYSFGYLVSVEKQNWRQNLIVSEEWQRLQKNAINGTKNPPKWVQKFKPFSLNIYLTRLCSMNCVYCFSSPSQKNQQLISPSTDAIIACAHMVVENCREEDKTMVLVTHGGGEPTMDNRLEPLVIYIKDLCKKKNVKIFTYLATNGMMDAAKAEKISQIFDLVGLSCDGPPEIQNQQRPLTNGSHSSPFIETVASIFHRNQQNFEVRVTLTRNSWPRMIDIATYFIERIHPNGINLELAYKTSKPPIYECEINTFVDLYLSAQAICQKVNIPWRSSAIRPSHHHRQYCHILQNTLQIIPGDIATNCFLDNDLIESLQRGMQIGAYNQHSKNWVIDFRKIDSLRRKLLINAQVCENCIASSHCHRSCPDVCPFDCKADVPDIHCQLNKRLFQEFLVRAGKQLIEYREKHHQLIAGKEIIAC